MSRDQITAVDEVSVEMGEEIVEDIDMAADSFVVTANDLGSTARSRHRSSRAQTGVNRGSTGSQHQQRSEVQHHFLGAHRDNLQEEHSFQDQEEAVTSGMCAYLFVKV